MIIALTTIIMTKIKTKINISTKAFAMKYCTFSEVFKL